MPGVTAGDRSRSAISFAVWLALAWIALYALPTFAVRSPLESAYTPQNGVHSRPVVDTSIHTISSASSLRASGQLFMYQEDLQDPLQYSAAPEDFVSDLGDPAIPLAARRGLFTAVITEPIEVSSGSFIPRVRIGDPGYASCSNCVLGALSRSAKVPLLCSACPGLINGTIWPEPALPGMFLVDPSTLTATWATVLRDVHVLSRHTLPAYFSATFGLVDWFSTDDVVAVLVIQTYRDSNPSGRAGRAALTAFSAARGEILDSIGFNVSLFGGPTDRPCHSSLNNGSALLVCDGADTMVYALQSVSGVMDIVLVNTIPGMSALSAGTAAPLFYSTPTSQSSPFTLSQLNPVTGRAVWQISDRSTPNLLCNSSASAYAPLFLQLSEFMNSSYRSCLLMVTQLEHGSCVTLVDVINGTVLHAMLLTMPDIRNVDVDLAGILYIQTAHELTAVMLDSAQPLWSIQFDTGASSYFAVFEDHLVTSAQPNLISVLRADCSPCQHGTCTPFNGLSSCMCTAPFVGSACDTCPYGQRCIHGSCDGDGKCVCEPGWQSAACDLMTADATSSCAQPGCATSTGASLSYPGMTAQPTMQWQAAVTQFNDTMVNDPIKFAVTLPCGDLITGSTSVVTRWDVTSGTMVWRTTSFPLPGVPSDYRRMLQSVAVPGIAPDLVLLIINVNNQTAPLPADCSSYGVLLNATTGTAISSNYLARFTAVDSSEFTTPVLVPDQSSCVLVCNPGLVTDGQRWSACYLYDIATLGFLNVVANASCSKPILHLSPAFIAVSLVMTGSAQQTLSSADPAAVGTEANRWIVLDGLTGAVLTSAISLDPACERFALVSLVPSTQPVLSQLALVCSSSSRASSVRVSDGTLNWNEPAASATNPIGDLVDLRWQLLDQDPVILIVRMNLVYALRAMNGAEVWTSAAQACCVDRISTYVLADIVLQLYSRGSLVAVSLQDGSALWSMRASTAVDSLAITGAGRGFYTIGDEFVTLYSTGCQPSCTHGTCDLSGKCSCQPTYRGAACDTCAGPSAQSCIMGLCSSNGTCGPCHYGYWGYDCTHECPNGASLPCGGSNHGLCHPFTGECICNTTLGWAGANCTAACPQAAGVVCGGSQYGSCLQGSATCSCTWQAYLNNVTRTCLACPVNSGTISGQLNSNASYCVSCPAGSYGVNPNECVRCLFAGCAGGIACAPGYRGDTCAQCEPDYYQQYDSKLSLTACLTCNGASLIIIAVLVVALLLATILLLWLQSKPAIQRSFAPLKVGYTYLQVVSLLGAVGLKWPYGVKSSLSIISTAMYNLGAASFGCWLAYDLRFYLTLLFPVLLGCCFLIVYAVFVWPAHRRQRRIELYDAFDESSLQVDTSSSKAEHEPLEDDTVDSFKGPNGDWPSSSGSQPLLNIVQSAADAPDAADQQGNLQCWRLCRARLCLDASIFSKRSPRQIAILMRRSLVSFLIFYYPIVLSEALSIFDCVSIRGDVYVRSLSNIECFRTYWFRFLPWSICAFVVYGIGIPVLVTRLLCITRWGRDEDGVRDWFGESLLMLKPQYRWWDLFSIIWRVAIVLVVMLSHSNGMRIGWLAALLIVRAALTAILRPATDTFEGREELVLLACTLLIALCALGFGADTNVSSSVEALLYALVMIALCIMVITIARATYRKISQQLAAARASPFAGADSSADSLMEPVSAVEIPADGTGAEPPAVQGSQA